MNISDWVRQKIHLHTGLKSVLPNMENRYYQALTPNSDIINGDEYFAALDWALCQKNICNIAISGPYGSGKSSIIKSYLARNPEKKVLNISLAAFNLNEMISEADANEKIIDQNKLENGILKQLLYSVDIEKIPQSRYRKIQNKKINYRNISFLILFVILILLGIVFFIPEKLLFFVFLIKKYVGLHPIITIIFSYIFILAAFIVLYKWYKDNFKFSEIKLGDKATLQGNTDNIESIFDKNMDEILYFFEKTKYNIVVIEDLDRFKSTNIFVALRELNNILNNYENIKTKVSFIYAIKDDMFIEEGERTKFFDFIIPVIPYISSTNSGEVLRERLKFDDKTNKSSIYEITGTFISLISPYITNMRDLVNICNEFNIIKNILKGNQELNLNDEQLFSLIVFKNLYPKDFAELESESDDSIVLTAFRNKKEKINSEQAKKESVINQEQTKINNLKKEALYDIKEIKLAFLAYLTNDNLTFRNIYLDNSSYTLSQMIEDNFDITQFQGKRNIEGIDSRGYHTIIISEVDEKIKASKRDYFDRIQNMKKGIQKIIEESRVNIEAYESKINVLHTYTMKEMIQEFGIDFLNESVTKNRLLVFFLREGYIDEHYEDYINYFHPNSITKQEMNFILSVRNHGPSIEYNYQLTHISQIFFKLQPHEFKQKEIFNFDLVDFVIENQLHSSAGHYLFDKLTDHSDDSMNFIRAYYDRGRNTDDFIIQLVHNNSILWRDIMNDDAIPFDKKCKYLTKIFQNSPIDEITLLDINKDDSQIGVLSFFLISNPTVLAEIQTVPTEKQIEIYGALDIEFYDTDLEAIDDVVKQDILTNWRYELNEKMISEMYLWKAPEQVNLLYKKNYTMIRFLNDKDLLEYVHKYFPDYVEKLVIQPDSNTEEELDAVEDMLERLLPEHVELCLKILNKEQVVWENINQCCNNVSADVSTQKGEIWDYLLDNNRIRCTWANFYAYYNSYGATDAWVFYFSNNIDNLINSAEPETVPENIRMELFNAELGDENFRKFITLIWQEQFKKDLTDLDTYKIKILIEEGRLSFSQKYWDELNSIAPDLQILYAEKNVDSFVESLPLLTIDEKVINSLLKSDIIPEREKTQILYKIPINSLTEETAVIVSEFVVQLEYSYLKAAWRILSNESRKRLLLNQLDYINCSEFSTLFSELDSEYNQLVQEPGKKYSLSLSEYNKLLLEKLYTRKYVTGINIDTTKQIITGSISRKWLNNTSEKKSGAGVCVL